MKTLIQNACVILRDSIVRGYVVLQGSAIAEVGRGECAAPPDVSEIIDAGGRYLSPGFFELHTHGAGGCDFMNDGGAEIETAVKTHLRHGTTSILPTTSAATREALLGVLDRFSAAKQAIKDGPNLIGLHLEGPYLNAAQKGAMDAQYLRAPDPAEYEMLVEHAQGNIARWTVAPELPGALAMGDFLTKNGILPSIGHSDAEYGQVCEAFAHGFTHVTHLYSATSTIVRRGGFRFPGVLESAFILHDMTVEVIADGCHLPPELLELVYRLKGPEKTCMVCDSISCAGIPASEGSLLQNRKNGRPIRIEDGVAKLPDRSAFAGSIAMDDQLIRVMRDKAGVPLVDCIAMMCQTPARILGLDGKKGSIAPGKDADLVLFDENIAVERVLVGGKTVYLKEEGSEVR